MCCGAVVNGWVLNLANLPEIITLCQHFYLPYVFSDYFVTTNPIFGRKIFRKTSIQKIMALVKKMNSLLMLCNA